MAKSLLLLLIQASLLANAVSGLLFSEPKPTEVRLGQPDRATHPEPTTPAVLGEGNANLLRRVANYPTLCGYYDGDIGITSFSVQAADELD